MRLEIAHFKHRADMYHIIIKRPPWSPVPFPALCNGLAAPDTMTASINTAEAHCEVIRNVQGGLKHNGNGSQLDATLDTFLWSAVIWM